MTRSCGWVEDVSRVTTLHQHMAFVLELGMAPGGDGPAQLLQCSLQTLGLSTYNHTDAVAPKLVLQTCYQAVQRMWLCRQGCRPTLLACAAWLEHDRPQFLCGLAARFRSEQLVMALTLTLNLTLTLT